MRRAQGGQGQYLAGHVQAREQVPRVQAAEAVGDEVDRLAGHDGVIQEIGFQLGRTLSEATGLAEFAPLSLVRSEKITCASGEILTRPIENPL